jgi:hypothetical protein
VIRASEIDISVRFPSDHIRMVMIQPHLTLVGPEPFKWSQDERDAQLTRITRCLEVAKAGDPPRFTVFPEYSVPGLDGVHVIDTAVRAENWSESTVVLAGVDGLDKDDYAVLCGQPDTHVGDANAPQRVGQNEWVNCSITWVKNTEGAVDRWVQPKIEPAWAEVDLNHQRMFRGSVVNVFQGILDRDQIPFRFFSMLCFDWIGRYGNQRIVDGLLGDLNQKWQGSRNEIHWAFVLQHNRKPNHHLFLNQTHSFLNDAGLAPCVVRTNATVVFANTAAGVLPCRAKEYGCTSLVQSAAAPFDVGNACKPSYCVQTEKLRSSDILNTCCDVVFREMGNCIHDLIIPISLFVTPDPSQRIHPVREASVYSTDDLEDPRVPGGPVFASVKWVNDCLDSPKTLSADFRDAALASEISTAEHTVTNTIRALASARLEKAVMCGRCPMGYSSGKSVKSTSVDEWDRREEQALEHFLNTMALFELALTVEIAEAPIHGLITVDTKSFELIAIKGDTHAQCRQYFEGEFLEAGNDFVMVVSRDRQNMKHLKEFTTAITSPRPPMFEQGPRFTDPRDRILQFGFMNFLECYCSCDTVDDLREAIRDHISSGN